jgi:hypothetical protein
VAQHHAVVLEGVVIPGTGQVGDVPVPEAVHVAGNGCFPGADGRLV